MLVCHDAFFNALLGAVAIYDSTLSFSPSGPCLLQTDLFQKEADPGLQTSRWSVERFHVLLRAKKVFARTKLLFRCIISFASTLGKVLQQN